MIAALPYAAQGPVTLLKPAPFAAISNVAPATSSVELPFTNTGTSTGWPGVPSTVSITHTASPSAGSAGASVGSTCDPASLIITLPGTTFESNSTILPDASLPCSTTWKLEKSISYSPTAISAGIVSLRLATVPPFLKL